MFCRFMSALHSFNGNDQTGDRDRMEQLLSINYDDHKCRLVMNVVVVFPFESKNPADEHVTVSVYTASSSVSIGISSMPRYILQFDAGVYRSVFSADFCSVAQIRSSPTQCTRLTTTICKSQIYCSIYLCMKLKAPKINLNIYIFSLSV